jgi:small-conductance mechanosensitive channel
MDFTEYINKLTADSSLLKSPTIINVINSILILLVLWVIRIALYKLIFKNITDIKMRYRWRKTFSFLMGFLALILIGRIWFAGIQSLATFLGLITAGIAIALKDPIANLAGWLFILARNTFEVGDRIQIGNFSGDVIDLSPFQFSMLEIGNWVDADQSTGRIVHVPNGKIFTNELANYDKGFKYIWNEIPVTVTFESDWQKAKEILLTIAKKQEEQITSTMEKQIKQAARKFMIYFKNLTPIVYTDVLDNGIRLTIRYLCESRRRRSTSESMWEDILKEFSQHKNIDLAYPTTRFYTEKRKES